MAEKKNFMDVKLNQYEIDKIISWLRENDPGVTKQDEIRLVNTLGMVSGAYFEFIDNVILTDGEDKNELKKRYGGDENPSRCSYHFGLTESITDNSVKKLVKDGVEGVGQLFSTLAYKKPALKKMERAIGYHRAFTIKNEMIETTWQDKFVNWYSEYTRGSANRGYLNPMATYVKSLPDEYCEFMEKCVMGVGDVIGDYQNYLNVRNPVAFEQKLKKAIEGHDPQGMEAVLMDIVNGYATVKNPQTSLDYFKTAHAFEMDFVENAVDPTAYREAGEKQERLQKEKYDDTLAKIDRCRAMQEAIIADMDAKKSADRAEMLRNLEEKRLDDHAWIEGELRFTPPIQKVFKRLSMRWDARKARNERLADYDRNKKVERKRAEKSLDELNDIRKHLTDQGIHATITNEFHQELDMRENDLEITIARREIELPTQREARVEAESQARTSVRERLEAQINPTTVQHHGAQRSEPEVPTRSEREEPMRTAPDEPVAGI
jgi:hypothetical protein